MRLLLDTCAFLWWITDAAELSTKARKAIASTANDCELSIASCWEMAVKVSLGKLALDRPVDRFITEHIAANGFKLRGIELRDIGWLEKLPFHHRDPFDRLLISQALADGIALVSADASLKRYGVKVIW